ncbi:site-specific integrase [Mucilaginibacter humi]|uniref:site-specific integrase n=1 Tax=Mucilaginibacter humi TaxID=2732510 RepID=UPI00293B8A42|nr:site-specific integrase [Mucilaginibacter humi]
MFLARFIQYIKFEKRYSPHTVSAYQSDLDQFISFLNHPDQTTSHPQEISHYQIRNWMVELMNRGLSARSINRKIATLRKYFKFLVQEGY